MADSFFTARIRMKPLLPDNMKEDNLSKALKQAQRTVLKKIQKEITQTVFSERAKIALSQHLRIEIKPSSLVVWIDHPGAESLIKGRLNRQMSWLVKSPTPIPIITETGKLIFRTATSRSMTNGPKTGPRAGTKPGWMHPGRPSNPFIEKARKVAREDLIEKFRKEFSRKKR